jgi:hypothetical protein
MEIPRENQPGTRTEDQPAGLAAKLGRRTALRAGVVGAAAAGALALGQRPASATTYVQTDPLTNNTCVLPTGDTTGVQDAANINGALSGNLNGQNVVLAAGQFYVNTTLMIPPGGVLKGQFANEVDVPTDHAWGSVISAVTSTSLPWKNAVVHYGTQDQATISAVVACVGQQAGGYSAPGDECKVYGIAIDCSGITGVSGVDGLQVFGDMSRPHLERVLIANAPNYGVSYINFIHHIDATHTITYGPDAAHLYRVQVWAAGSHGFYHPKISDCTYFDCLAEHCGGSGFYIQNGSNGVWNVCRSENNGDNGYYYTCSSTSTGSGVAHFIGCSSDRNSTHGIYITNTTPSNALPVVLSGCTFRRDGSDGDTNNAGITIYGYPGPVQISGCTVWPGVGDDGDGNYSPNYGMRLANNNNAPTAQVVVAGSYIQGHGAFLSDDGTTLDVRWGPDVIGASGKTDGPPAVRGPRMGVKNLSNGQKTVNCTCVTSNSIIFVTKANGGSNGILGVTNLVVGQSFDVTSSNTSDSSAFYWQIMNP